MITARSYRSPKRERQALATRRKALAAARELFARKGFAATTVAEIASTARLSEPTIYKLFGSKAGLMREQLDEVDRLAGVAELLAVVRDETASPRAQAYALASFQGKLVEQHGPLIAAARVSPDPDLRAFIENGLERHRLGVAALTMSWDRRGKLRPGLTGELAGAIVATICSSETYHALRHHHGWPQDHCIDWLTQTVLELAVDSTERD